MWVHVSNERRLCKTITQACSSHSGVCEINAHQSAICFIDVISPFNPCVNVDISAPALWQKRAFILQCWTALLRAHISQLWCWGSRGGLFLKCRWAFISKTPVTVYSVHVVAKCGETKMSNENCLVRLSHVNTSLVKPKSMSNWTSNSKSTSEMSSTLRLGSLELHEMRAGCQEPRWQKLFPS